MALKNIKKNKAYVGRQAGTSVSSSTDAFNSNWIDPTAPTTTTTNSGNFDMNADQGDEFASPISGPNAGQSFNYSTGKFANGNKATTSTASTTSSNRPTPFNYAGAGYKSNVSKNGGITVKKDLGYDLTDFGDVNTLGNKYKGEGYKIPTFGENIDFTKIPQLGEAGQEFDRFGKQAELMEAQTPGFLNKRNDAYLAELARTNPDFNTLDEASQKQAIAELLQQRDVKGELFSGSKGQQDVLNTINSIYNRIGQGKSQNQLMNEKATQLYDTEQGNIDSMYQAEKNNFLKAGAVEDRFTNFNEVESKIQNTLLAAGQHRADNLYTGTPTDEQIGEIAQSLGQDFATTKKILEGRGYEDLQLQDEFNKEASQGYDRQMQDLEINKQRAEEDADLQHQRTQAVLDQQIEDTKLQMQQDLAMGEKAGALSGAVRSSGYMDALGSIQSQYMKNIGRLQERKARDTEDTVQNKKRISEITQLNATRNKEDLNNTIKEIKMKMGLELSQYQEQYGSSSTELERKLNEITNKYGLMSQKAFSDYTANLRGITDTMTYDTEKILELQQKKQTLQQVTVGNLLADNGMALAGLSKNELQTMVQNGTISNADYSAMTGYMQSLGIATLQSKGVPTQEDISLYTSLLDSGVSPQQAITTVMSRSPDRYTGADAKDRYIKMGDNNLFDTTTQSFVSTPGSTGGTQPSYTGPTIPPATPEKLNASFSKYTNMKNGSVVRGGQCGMFVNDYIKEATGIGNNMFVDPINIRKTQINRDKSDPSVGSVIVMTSSGTPNATEYGHVGIVTGINADGSINIKDQNGKIKGAVGAQTIPANDPKIVGFFDPQLGLQSGGVQTSQAGIDDIISFNDDVTRRKMSKEEVKRIGEQKQSIMKNPQSSISDILQRSAGGKSVGAEQSKSFAKYSQAMGQIDSIQKQISDMKTGPILGALRNLNPYDTSAQVLKSKLQGLVPTIARGVYGEVGVLTDQDVQLYAKTLPNLKSTADVNKGVLAYTLDILAGGYKKQLSSLAGQGYDVSGMEGEYENIKGQAEALKNEIGIYSNEQNAQKGQELFNSVFNKAQAKKTGKSNTTSSTFANWKKSKGL